VTPTNNALGAILTIVAMLAFASMDAISKWLVADYSIAQMMWIRYGVFCIFAWLVVQPRGGFRKALRSERPVLQAIRAVLAVIESALFVLAFSYLPLADTHALAATSPLIVIVFGALFLRETVDRARWLAVLVGFAGMLLIVRPGFRTLDWPLLIPVAGAVLWGVYQLLTRFCSRTDSADTTLVWSALAAFVATSFVGPWSWHWPDAKSWALLLAMAALGAIAHYALIRALDYAEASAVQPYAYTMLVWVTILGAVVFGDFPDGWTIAGAVVIVGSSFYAWLQDRRAIAATP
jgi:drug/metabolite transporter (DMT)-like permease